MALPAGSVTVRVSGPSGALQNHTCPDCRALKSKLGVSRNGCPASGNSSANFQNAATPSG